jgi:hypothetical protein
MPNSLIGPVIGYRHGQLSQDPNGCLAAETTRFVQFGVPATASEWSCPESASARLRSLLMSRRSPQPGRTFIMDSVVRRPEGSDLPGFGEFDPVRNLRFITCTGD